MNKIIPSSSTLCNVPTTQEVWCTERKNKLLIRDATQPKFPINGQLALDNKGSIDCSVFCHHTQSVWIGFSDGSLMVIDAATRALQRVVALSKQSGLASLHSTSGSSNVVAITRDNTFFALDPRTCTVSRVGLLDARRRLSCIGPCIEGKILLLGNHDGSVSAADLHSGKEMTRCLDVHEGGVLCMACNGSNSWVFTGGHDGCISKLRLQPNRVTFEGSVEVHSNYVHKIATCGIFLVSCSSDGQVCVLTVRALQVIQKVQLQPGVCVREVLSLDTGGISSRVLLSLSDGTYRAMTLRQPAQPSPERSHVMDDASFDPEDHASLLDQFSALFGQLRAVEDHESASRKRIVDAWRTETEMWGRIASVVMTARFDTGFWATAAVQLSEADSRNNIANSWFAESHQIFAEVQHCFGFAAERQEACERSELLNSFEEAVGPLSAVRDLIRSVHMHEKECEATSSRLEDALQAAHAYSIEVENCQRLLEERNESLTIETATSMRLVQEREELIENVKSVQKELLQAESNCKQLTQLPLVNASCEEADARMSIVTVESQSYSSLLTSFTNATLKISLDVQKAAQTEQQESTKALSEVASVRFVAIESQREARIAASRLETVEKDLEDAVATAKKCEVELRASCDKEAQLRTELRQSDEELIQAKSQIADLLGRMEDIMNVTEEKQCALEFSRQTCTSLNGILHRLASCVSPLRRHCEDQILAQQSSQQTSRIKMMLREMQYDLAAVRRSEAACMIASNDVDVKPLDHIGELFQKATYIQETLIGEIEASCVLMMKHECDVFIRDIGPLLLEAESLEL